MLRRVGWPADSSWDRVARSVPAGVERVESLEAIGEGEIENPIEDIGQEAFMFLGFGICILRLPRAMCQGRSMPWIRQP